MIEYHFKAIYALFSQITNVANYVPYMPKILAMEFFLTNIMSASSVDYTYTPAQVKLNSFTKKFKSWLLLSGAELGSSQTRINGDIWEICNLVVLELVGIWVHFFRLLPVILERWSKYDSKSYCTPSYAEVEVIDVVDIFWCFVVFSFILW